MVNLGTLKPLVRFLRLGAQGNANSPKRVVMLSKTLQRYQNIKDEAVRQGLSVQGGRNPPTTPDDAAFLTTMNALSRPAPVPVSEAIEYLLEADIYVPLVESSIPGSKNLVMRLNPAQPETSRPVRIDMATAGVIRDVDRCVDASIWSRTQADDFLALGENRQSIAQELGVGLLRQRDLGRMRIEFDKGLIT